MRVMERTWRRAIRTPRAGLLVAPAAFALAVAGGVPGAAARPAAHGAPCPPQGAHVLVKGRIARVYWTRQANGARTVSGCVLGGRRPMTLIDGNQRGPGRSSIGAVAVAGPIVAYVR